MSQSLYLPQRGSRLPLADRSGLLFSLDAEDVVRRATLTARTGQAATFSRAGAAFTRDANGFLVPVVHSEPRIEAILNADGLYEPCLLLERATTNALTAPEDFTNAAWTKTNVTATANQVASPRCDRAVTADKVLETSATGAHTVTQGTGTITANTTQSKRIFVQANGRTYVRFYLVNGSDYFGVEAHLSGDGTVAAYTGGSGTLAHSAIRALANGWYEIEVAGIINAASTSATWTLALESASGTASYAGDTSKGVYLWGAQLEVDTARPSTYAGASRVVDTLTYPFNALPQALTVYCRFVLRDGFEANRGLVGIGSAATPTTPYFIVYLPSGGSGPAVSYHDGTGGHSVSVAASLTAGKFLEARAVLDVDGTCYVGVSQEGGAETVSADATAGLTFPAAWGTAQIDIGRMSSTEQAICPIRTVRVFGGVKTIAECRGAR